MRNEEVKEGGLDPTLQQMSTAELLRMLELIDLMEGKQIEKVSPRDLATLNYLMEAYQV